MSKLEQLLRSKKQLIPYITLGDPSLQKTETLIQAAFESGVDILELGIPFSDPIADGPVIQASHQRALETDPHIGVKEAFQLIKTVKPADKAIVMMLSANLVYRFGIQAFFEAAKQSGLDAVIMPDLPVEEAKDYQIEAQKNNIPIIFLVSILCEAYRLKSIVKASEGFLYLISTTGTTGKRDSVSDAVQEMIQKIKAIRDIPVAVGFGISQPEHVQKVWQDAEAAIVGSHFVQVIAENADDPKRAFSAAIQRFLKL